MKFGREWGKHTWIFFHCLAEKLNEQNFKFITPIIFSWIKDLCAILPCPDCSNHATIFLKSYKYYYKINCKDDFKLFLLGMHNTVNARTGKPIYTKSILEQYKDMKLNKVTADWFNNFVVNIVDVKLLSEKKQRYLTKNKVLRELKENIKYFTV